MNPAKHEAAATASLQSSIADDGFAFVSGSDMRERLAQFGSLADWARFADSWRELEVDTYMADGGRYRRRRHAVFSCLPGLPIAQEPHQPHFQPIDYNPLNGGVERWFEPIEPWVSGSASMRTILTFCRSLFEGLTAAPTRWHIEVHQFRIEARRNEAGRPTRKACTATASTTSSSSWSAVRTSRAASQRFTPWTAGRSDTSRSPIHSTPHSATSSSLLLPGRRRVAAAEAVGRATSRRA